MKKMQKPTKNIKPVDIVKFTITNFSEFFFDFWCRS